MNTPSQYPPLSSYITVKDATTAIEFYKAAFGATELYRLTMGDSGVVAHAELTINGGLFMLSDEFPGMNTSPQTLGGSPMTFCLMVDDADASFAKAIAAGATVKSAVADQFYGFRSGSIVDPFGHQWMIQHQLEQLTPQQMQQRMNEMSGNC